MSEKLQLALVDSAMSPLLQLRMLRNAIKRTIKGKFVILLKDKRKNQLFLGLSRTLGRFISLFQQWRISRRLLPSVHNFLSSKLKFKGLLISFVFVSERAFLGIFQ
ncbi:uncharacterized protein [Solanum tuberosum]|uniref:uncharacterized protein n=1 Tax=Solanum tuberosum TaxID=4113 RepID=UPI00073A3471|nr:PREDICTED: uncharacterized protein LOC102587864 [Solanum tuberosum]